MVAERVVTVEYLIPSMSKELVTKFPDSSAFDFDYSQSGIWSPLLPRGRRSSLDNSIMKRLLDGSGKKKASNGKKLRKFKEKIIQKSLKKIGKKRLDFSPESVPRKGLSRMLRAAAKRFKTQKKCSWQGILPTQ